VRPNFYRGRITMPKGNRRRRVVLEPELEEILDSLIKSKKAAALERLLSRPAAEREDKEEVIQRVDGGLPVHDVNRDAPRSPPTFGGHSILYLRQPGSGGSATTTCGTPTQPIY
jgi:hypothetical protein